MQMITVTLAVTFSCLLLLQHVNNADAAPSRERRAALELKNPDLTLAVLEELVDNMKRQYMSLKKRRIDAGYGSRYRIASSVGSKMMALKQAADWNGPGRKRRDVMAQEEQE